jgi:predicted O-methyltransferase YrrM
MANRWSKMSRERLALGLCRYLGATVAAFKFLIVYPLFRTKRANRFSFGVLSLQDELDYACPDIPSLPISDLFPDVVNEDVQVGQTFPWEGSSISALEMINLAAIIKTLKPKRVFEIGTSMGVTAYNLALNLPPDGELYTLDLPPATESSDTVKTEFAVTVSDRKMIFADRRERRFLNTKIADRIQQLYGDSATFDYTPYNGTCDVVFVDGSHALKYVESDTEAAFKLAKPGGWVIWHDYNDGFFWPDVRRYLKQIANRRKIRRIKGTMFAISQA